MDIFLSNILFSLFGLLILRLVLSKYYFKINHVTIFSIIWLFIILMSQITAYAPLEIKTLTILYLSWYFFLIGSIIINKKNSINKCNTSINLNLLKKICYTLVILTVLANYKLLIDVFVNFKSIESWAIMRNEKVFTQYRDDNIFYTLFGTNNPIIVPLSIYLFRAKKISKLSFVIIYSIIILCSIAAFTRAPLLNIIIISLISYIFIYNSIPKRAIIILSTGLVFIFTISQFFLSNGNIESSNDILIVIEKYIFGGVAAYQNLLDGKYLFNSKVYDSPYYSFDFINYILNKFGIIESYPSIIREYDTTFGTNVYTYLDCFTLDFGVFGAFLGSYLIGLVCKVSYCIYIKKEDILKLSIYASLCYYCSFIFMNNEFIRISIFILILKIYIIYQIHNINKLHEKH